MQPSVINGNGRKNKMPYCPKCREEFDAEEMVCPDCNATLVEALPMGAGAAVMPDTSWVVMGQVVSDVKSEMAKGSLDSNNIPSMILSSSFNALGGGIDSKQSMMDAGSEGNVIMVPREYREDAMFILEAVLGDDLIQTEF